MERLLLIISVALMIGWSYSQAPGDGDDFCFTTLGSLRPTYFANMRPIMDSRDYRNLLGQGDNPVWQQVDVDMIDTGGNPTSWIQNSNLQCRQSLLVCGFAEGNQDNWLITQHISRNISGILLDQAVVTVEFEFNGCTASVSCVRTFTIQRYDTSMIDPTAAANISNYRLVDTIAPNDVTGNIRQNESAFIDFVGDETEAVGDATGFYLAFRDQSSCLFIRRVLVFYSVCPAIAQDLIVHPETRAPRIDPVSSSSEPIILSGTCIENAHPEFGDSPSISCSGGGVWSEVFGCVCNEGFQPTEDGDACVGCPAGQYAASNGTCINCPANSNSTGLVIECPCLEGFYRADTDEPGDPCTKPPLAPQNLAVVNFTNISVYLTWDSPLFTGGRDDIEYELSYNRSDGTGDWMVYGRVITTEGQTSGLTPFTEYVVYVSAENRVSSQVPDASGRTATATVTTEEGVPSVIDNSTIQVDEDSDVVSWDPPTDPGGKILFYQILITRDGENVRTEETTENSLDVSSLGLDAGIYELQIRAVTAIGVGNYSMPVTINVNEQDNPTSDMSAVIIGVTVGSASVILLFVVGSVLLMYCIFRKKSTRKQMHFSPKNIEKTPPSTDLSGISSPTFQLLQLLPHEMIIHINCIKLLESIGEGQFGIVYKAHFKRYESAETEVVAVKTLKGIFTAHDLQNMTEEIMKMQGLDHPNVMKFLGICLNVNSVPCIIMSYMANGSLLSYIRRQKGSLVLSGDADITQIESVQATLLKMCFEIAKGMEYLAEQMFVHRDLAARNCMIDGNGSIKVADFGLAEDVYTKTYFRQDSSSPVLVPFKWMPPESLEEGVFSEKSDVWSYGITCWEVFSAGKIPYAGVGGREVLNLLKHGERLEKPENPACSQVIYSTLMLQCWDDDPNKRPPFSELVSTLSAMLESAAGYLDLRVFIQDIPPRD